MHLFNIHLITYWTLCGVFFLLDVYVYNCKIVNLYKQNPINDTYWYYCLDSAKASIKNQILVTLPVAIFIENYYDNIEITTVQSELVKILFYILFADIWFFIFHYTCHMVPFIYKFHKYHHRIYSTSAVSALDADMLEHLIINLGSICIGPFLWTGCKTTVILWSASSTAVACMSHSGYKHWLVGTKHNLHHRKCKYNYGQGICIMDRLFGTYRLETLN